MSTTDVAVLDPIETAPAPGYNEAGAVEDAILKAVVLSNVHHCCTVAMMEREDVGVVHGQIRVRLRVVDASLLPLVVGGGLQASIYAGAGKSADLIKARHGLL